MIKRLSNLKEYLVQEELYEEANLLGLFILKTAQSTYTIQSGDTIYGLSGGDPVYQKLILEANPGLNPKNLQLGQKIKMPNKPERSNEGMSYSSSLIEIIKKYEGFPADSPSDEDCRERKDEWCLYKRTCKEQTEWSKGDPILCPYNDKFGNITIGWGHNLGKINISEVRPITVIQAEKLLVDDLKKAAGFVARNVSASLNQHQFDALTSLTFNAGPSAVYKTRLFKAVNSGDFRSAIQLFPTTLVGKNQGGLQIRRNEEAAMFKGGVGTY
jgi:lysozyme